MNDIFEGIALASARVRANTDLGLYKLINLCAPLLHFSVSSILSIKKKIVSSSGGGLKSVSMSSHRSAS